MALLDGHPELLVNANESHFFQRFLPAASRLNSELEMKLAQDVLLESWHPGNSYYRHFLSHISHKDVIDNFKMRIKDSDKDYPNYLTAAIMAYGEVSGQLTDKKHQWVEKTPGNEHYADLIFDWWPEAQCIHMIRDPRDLYASYKKRALKHGRALPKIGGIAYQWQRSLHALDRNIETYGEARYMSLRYEDLVLDPERHLTRVAAFLGIQMADDLFVPTKGGGMYDWRGNAVDRQYSSISDSSVGRWQQQISEHEVALLEILLRDDMQRYEYVPQLQAGSLARLEAVWIKAINLGRELRTKIRMLW